MNFEDLLKLNIDSQIEYLNNNLNEGVSVKEIRETLGIGEKKLQKHLKSINYKYDQKAKNYVLVTEEVILPNPVTKPLESVKGENNYKDNELVVNKNETHPSVNIKFNDYDKLLNIINTYEDMSNKIEQMDEMYKWYELQKSNENIIDIEIPKLEILPTSQEAVSRSFKVYKDVMDEFSDFCKKNNNYKVQDILTQAMREFLDKYNK